MIVCIACVKKEGDTHFLHYFISRSLSWRKRPVVSEIKMVFVLKMMAEKNSNF